jgi:hypothetical protein
MDTRTVVDFELPETPGEVAIQSEEVRLETEKDPEDSED